MLELSFEISYIPLKIERSHKSLLKVSMTDFCYLHGFLL